MKTTQTINDKMLNTNSILGMLFVAFAVLNFSCKEATRISSNQDKSATFLFSKKLECFNSLEFSSWQGELLGLDSDQVLIFSKDGTVILRNYGYDVSRYDGTYELGEDNSVKIDFKGLRDDWPIMIIFIKDENFFLRRRDGLTTPTIELEKEEHYKNYWPFGETGSVEGESSNLSHDKGCTCKLPLP